MNKKKDGTDEEVTKLYKCKYCNKSYKLLKSYKSHLKNHKNESIFIRKVDNSSRNITKGRVVIKPKKRKCKICTNAVFVNEEDYLYHIKNVHDGKYVDYLMCADCGKQFRTKNELRHHIQSKCGTIKQYQCKYCNLNLMTPGSLHNHLLRHEGEKSYMCRFCGKLFLTAGQLKVHERKHTKEKAFICTVCGKGFSFRQSLITHSTIHTGIKPYQCESCGNSFSCIGNLLKHRKWHPDTCGSIQLTTHRVNNPLTKIRVKVNTPSTTKVMKLSKKDMEIKEKLNVLEKQIKMSDTDVKTSNNGKVGSVSNAKDYEMSIIDEIKLERVSSPVNCIELTVEESDDLLDINIKEDDTVDIVNVNVEMHENLETDPEVICLEKLEDCKHSGTIVNEEHLLRHEVSHQKQANNTYNCKKVFTTDNNTKLQIENNSLDGTTSRSHDKIFSDRNILKKLQKNNSKNIAKKNYICEKCGKEFKQKQTLQYHSESLCGTSLSYECNICHKKFTSIYIRNNHAKVHDVKRLLCKFCGKSFHWKGQLKIHERSHTGEKPYTCLYCPKAFAYRESLLTHSTIHTGIKPYICESCGYSFSCIGNLIKHKDIHSNICGPYNKAKV